MRSLYPVLPAVAILALVASMVGIVYEAVFRSGAPPVILYEVEPQTSISPNGTTAVVSVALSTLSSVVTSPGFDIPIPWFFVPGTYLTNVGWHESLGGRSYVVEINGSVPAGERDYALLCQYIVLPRATLVNGTAVATVAAGYALLAYQYVILALYDIDTGSWAWYNYTSVPALRWTTISFSVNTSALRPGGQYYYCVIYYVYNPYITQTFTLYVDYADLVIGADTPFFSRWVVGVYNRELYGLDYTARVEIRAPTATGVEEVRLTDGARYTDRPATASRGSVVDPVSSDFDLTRIPIGVHLMIVSPTPVSTELGVDYMYGAAHITVLRIRVNAGTS